MAWLSLRLAKMIHLRGQTEEEGRGEDLTGGRGGENRRKVGQNGAKRHKQGPKWGYGGQRENREGEGDNPDFIFSFLVISFFTRALFSLFAFSLFVACPPLFFFSFLCSAAPIDAPPPIFFRVPVWPGPYFWPLRGVAKKKIKIIAKNVPKKIFLHRILI